MRQQVLVFVSAFSALIAVSAYATETVVKFAAEEAGVIKLAPFQSAKIRVGFAVSTEHGEYARFENAGMKAELVYDEAVGDSVSLHYGYSLARMIEGWNLNAANAISYGAKGNVLSGYNDFLVQAYQLANGFAYVGFDYQWDEPAGDPEGHPSKVLFGYVCKKQAGPLDRGQIVGIINNLDAEHAASVSNNLPTSGSAGSDPAALGAAKGPAGQWGNKGFPFNFGLEFTENTAS
jgi:hypothetical protein